MSDSFKEWVDANLKFACEMAFKALFVLANIVLAIAFTVGVLSVLSVFGFAFFLLFR